MAAHSIFRQLARSGSLISSLAPVSVLGSSNAASEGLWRGFATDVAPFSRKEVIYNLDNAADPEAQAAIKAFQRQAFAAAAKGAAAAAPEEPDLEFTSSIERKYIAAQIVETGIQNVSVPLAYDKEGGVAALKRYAAQLLAVGKQAGFAAPVAELKAQLGEAAKGAESAKELLTKIKPFTSPEYHAALSEALNAVEAELGSAVSLDAGSAGFKAFTARVQGVAQASKLPWQLLLSYATKLEGASEEQADALAKDFASWVEAAQIADIKAELGELRGAAQRLLDAHLSKTAEAIKAEQAAAAAAVLRKVEAAKGAAWASKYAQDLEYVAWFDAKVAADPANGPRAAA